ncbi:hypothetical protein [Staphylococcus phage vB_SsapH-Golestan101-M]|nr:hypothetical protein [Staphylococcus phage vB_SsapH-Golestan101-M]
MDKQLPKFSVFKVTKYKVDNSKEVVSGTISKEYYFSTKELAQKYINQYKYVTNIACKVEEVKVNEEGTLNG